MAGHSLKLPKNPTKERNDSAEKTESKFETMLVISSEGDFEMKKQITSVVFLDGSVKKIYI